MAKKKMSLGVIGTAIVMASYGVWKSQEDKIKSLIPARVGSFGDIIFQVNSRTVLTPKKLTHTASASYGSHSMLSGKPRLQYIGPSLEDVKLEIVLRADFGARPRTQLAALHKMLQDGTNHAYVSTELISRIYTILDAYSNQLITGMSTMEEQTNLSAALQELSAALSGL